MRLTLLASGSRGNAIWVEGRQGRFQIDAGIAPKEVRRRLGRIGAEVPEKPDALLVTHEHADHGRCAGTLGARDVPVLGTAGTLDVLEVKGQAIVAGARQSIGSVDVTAVSLPHDAADPVGYLLEEDGLRAGILTDLGWPDPEVVRRFAGLDVLVLEANHDEVMLTMGPYVEGLKRRIAGNYGHLSNRQAVDLLRLLEAQGGLPRFLVLAHLSQTNNRPAVALAAVSSVFRARDRLVVATQGAATPWIDVGSAGEKGRQLSLGLGSGRAT